MAKQTTPKRRYSFEPDYAVPPGATLLETISSLGIDQKELAERTEFTEKHISQIIKGKVAISPDASIRLERVTGVPAGFWDSLESQHQGQLAKAAARQQLQADLEWLKRIPVRELMRRDALAHSDDSIEILESVLHFFGVASVSAWKKGWSKPEFAFRKSPVTPAHDGALAAWLRLGEIEASETDCRPFNAKRFRSHLAEIRSLTTEDPDTFVPRMIELCADGGVALALVQEIKSAPVNGAAKWLTPKKAMVCLNLRGKVNDRFWFTFFHEAGHILNDSKREVFVDSEYCDDPREHAANSFAARFLIPARYESQFKRLKSKASVVEFSASIGIHPGIVVGRLQREGILPYSHLNFLKERFEWAEA